MKLIFLYAPPKHSEIPLTQLYLFFSVLQITLLRVSYPPTKKSHFGFLDTSALSRGLAGRRILGHMAELPGRTLATHQAQRLAAGRQKVGQAWNSEMLKPAAFGAAFFWLLCHACSNSCSSLSKPINSLPYNNKKSPEKSHLSWKRQSHHHLLPPYSSPSFRRIFIFSKAEVAIRLLKATDWDLMENMAQGALIWFNMIYSDSSHWTRQGIVLPSDGASRSLQYFFHLSKVHVTR